MGFTVEFTRLWSAANPPSQRAFAAAAAERARRESIAVSESAFRNRVSDWLNGRLPTKDSEALPVVLRELFAIAGRKGTLNGIPTGIAHWESLLDAPENIVEDRCPYKGLEAYGTADAGDFFGRSEATADVMRLVSQATQTGGFVIVAGASGAGKSSLLAAGVIPAVTREYSVPVLSLTPGAHPMSSLSGHSGDQPLEMGSDAEWRSRVHQWIENFRQLVRQAGGTQGLVFVDQFEEIFTVTEDQKERARFIDALASMTALGEDGSPAPAVVVIGVRADFLGQLLNLDVFEESLRTKLYLLRAMSARELHEVITEPARKAHLNLEPGLEQTVIRDVCGPEGHSQTEAGALPLLSHALAATWQNRQRHKLTVVGYEKAGGVAGALTTTAETVLSALSADEKAAARQIVMRLIHIGEDTRDTRRPRSRLDLLDFPADRQKAAETAFSALTGARLITIDADTANLAHEALITGWPRLREWIEEDRAGQLVLQRLERAGEDWEAQDRDSHLLYAGNQLANADAIPTGDHSLTRRASEFLRKSRENQAAQNRRRQAVRAALVSLSVVALTLAIIAGLTARNASIERDAAQLGQVAAEAQKLTLTDPSLSAQLNLVARDLKPSDEGTYTRLLTTENLPLATLLTGQQGAIYTIAVSSDGRTLASSAYDNSIWLWNISDQTKPVKITQIGGACVTEKTCEGHDNFVTSVAFSPDGKTLASTGGDKTVRLWNLTDPAHPKQLAKLTNHTGTVYYCAFSPDGKILATGSGDNTVRLWDVAEVNRPTPGAVLAGHTKGVRTVAFSPDGHTVASGGDDRTVRLWDVTDANTAVPLGQPLTGHTDTTHNVTFSPNGKILASGADDNTVRLWDLSDRAAPTLLGQPFSGHTGPIWSVAFGPDGRTLATSSLDNTAKVFNILNPAKPIQLGQTLAGGGSSIYSVAYTNGGRTIATSDASGTIRLWSIPTTTLTGHAGRVIKPSIAHGRMASASYDGTVNLWDISDPAHARTLATVHDPAGRNVYEVALSPDGKLLATAIVDTVNGALAGSVEIRSIDAAGRLTLLTTLHMPTQYQDHVVFSPDSRILATASNDSSYQLWDMANPAQPKKLGSPLVHSSASTTTDSAKWATGAAFSPDAKVLVLSGADKELTLWDISNPKAAKKLSTTSGAHEKAINFVAFSPDGHTVASGGDDRTIRLWNVHDGKIEPVSTLTGLPNTVRTLEFTDGGRKLVSAGDGQIVLLWDTSDPAEPHQIGQPISIPGNGRWYAAVDPAAKMVVAGGDNGALQITLLDEQYARERICHDTHNVMNETLWDEHVPNGIDYNPPCSP